MDEARRFLRYVLPGLVFGLEAILLFVLLRPDLIGALGKALNTASGLGSAVAGFLVSGAVGFLCGTVHHAIHWRKTGKVMDHSASLKRLVRAGILELRVPGENDPLPESPLNRERAWVLNSAIWYERRMTNKRIQGADAHARALTDLVHTLGSARVAAMLAPITAFGIAACISTRSGEGWALTGFAIAFILAILIAVLFWCAYLRTARLTVAVIDTILADALIAEKEAPLPNGTGGRGVLTHPPFCAELKAPTHSQAADTTKGES